MAMINLLQVWIIYRLSTTWSTLNLTLKQKENCPHWDHNYTSSNCKTHKVRQRPFINNNFSLLKMYFHIQEEWITGEIKQQISPFLFLKSIDKPLERCRPLCHPGPRRRMRRNHLPFPIRRLALPRWMIVRCWWRDCCCCSPQTRRIHWLLGTAQSWYYC